MAETLDIATDNVLDLPPAFEQQVTFSDIDLSAPPVIHEGQTYVGLSVKGLEALGVPAAAILDGVKRDLFAKVDDQAERERLRWITPGSGQAQEYQEVRAQAQAALADPANATAELYPMLAGTIGIDFDPETKAPATDILGVARGVVVASKAWLAVGTHIRTVRLTSKAEIEAATSLEAARAAFKAIDWNPPAEPKT